MDTSEIYAKHKKKEMKMLRFIGSVTNWKSCMTIRKVVGYRINSNCYLVTEVYNSVSKLEIPKDDMIDKSPNFHINEYRKDKQYILTDVACYYNQIQNRI